MDADEIKLAKASVDAAFSDHIQGLYKALNADTVSGDVGQATSAMVKGLNRAHGIRAAMLYYIESKANKS